MEKVHSPISSANKHKSRLATALTQLTKKYEASLPDGVFGRRAIIESWAVTLDSDEYDLEFEVKFDDDLEANEAEIKVYNLTQNTIKNLIVKKPISITAGYKGDTGVIFRGYISKVKTKREGCDKITTIYALDSFDLQEKDLTDITYAAGSTASQILKDLIGKTNLPIAVFEPKRDWTYTDEQSISGGLMDSIRKYSEVCGISTYINQGKVYAQSVSKGINGYFNLSSDTGLIDSPEEFQEKITAEDYEDVVNGYTVKSLLQHRITTASVVNLQSREIRGEYRVRSGSHIFNESEAITEMELV